VSADEPLDLAAVAAAHPTRTVVLDFEKLDPASLLSVGDVADMAEALGTSPDGLLGVLSRPGRPRLEVALVIAWIIGRKAEPALTLETVRSSWRIEVRGEGVIRPRRARTTTAHSSGRRSSSASRA